MHQAGEWVGERLRLGKRPMLWCYRPSVWPPWNARNRRVARVWSAATGLDDDTIESLRSGRRPSIVEPSEHELREQLVEESAASRAHLRQIVDDYWEPEWRRRRRGEEREDYLWRAAAGLIDARSRTLSRRSATESLLTDLLTDGPSQGAIHRASPASEPRENVAIPTNPAPDDTSRNALARTHNPKVAGSNPAPATIFPGQRAAFRCSPLPRLGISQRSHTSSQNRSGMPAIAAFGRALGRAGIGRTVRREMRPGQRVGLGLSKRNPTFGRGRSDRDVA